MKFRSGEDAEMNDVKQEPASRGGKRMFSAFAAAGLLGMMLEYAVRGRGLISAFMGRTAGLF